MPQKFFLQNPLNGGGNAFVTVRGFPTPGASIYSQPYHGGPAQQWIPAQYPGNDLDNTGGVVCVLYSADEPNLVLAGGQCQQPTTLQTFQQGNRYQLWAYPGTSGQGVWVNCGNGCVLDLAGGNPTGVVQTWPIVGPNGNNNQQWALLRDTQADQLFTADAPAPEADTGD